MTRWASACLCARPDADHEVHGFPHFKPEKTYSVHVINNPKRDAGLFVRDHIEPATSAAVICWRCRMSHFGAGTGYRRSPPEQPVAAQERHGLKQRVPQAGGSPWTTTALYMVE